MKKFIPLLKKPKVYIPTGIVIVVITIVVLTSGGGQTGIETRQVELRTVAHVVDETGVVESAQEAELGFEVSGRVAHIVHDAGAQVAAGEILMSLDLGTLPAELLQAKADVAIKQAEFANTETNLNEVIKKQDTLVASARSTLLSSGLTAEPDSDTYTQTAPIITGHYNGEEGTYKVRVTQDDSNTGDYNLRTFGIETFGSITINETGPTQLGTGGLFITFPDSIQDYKDTIWYVAIPNTKSNSYTANYNAYQEALRTRENAIEDAQARIKEQQIGGSIAAAELQKAEANLTRVQAEIEKRRLRAPFDGTITDVDVEVGEIISPSTPVMSLLSNSLFEITVPVPEADIADVDVGDVAVVTFDAYDDEEFAASVSFVPPRAEKEEGVPVFDTTLVFNEPDPRIRSGLSADVEIQAETHPNVLAIPARAVIRSEGRTFVRMLNNNNTITETDIEVGLRGSDGFVEITNGLAEGDTVITFIDETTLAQMTTNK